MKGRPSMTRFALMVKGNNAYVSTSILNKITNSRRTEISTFALTDDEMLRCKLPLLSFLCSYVYQHKQAKKNWPAVERLSNFSPEKRIISIKTLFGIVVLFSHF